MLGRTHTTVAPERSGGVVRHLVYLAGEPGTTPAGGLYEGAAASLRHASRLDRDLAGLARVIGFGLTTKFVAPIGGVKRNDYQFTAIDDRAPLRVLRF
jgi:hypothetical protein